MATRGAIFRKTEAGGIEGRYQHWDSYPEGLGAELYRLYNGHFNKDLTSMLSVLIDQHPAGWSVICDKDFSLYPGFCDIDDDSRRPQCYCHGSRSEPACLLITLSGARHLGCEYAYIFDAQTNTMVIQARDGEKWTLFKVVDLNAPEPDWCSDDHSDDDDDDEIF